SLIDVVPETGYTLSYWSKHDINLSSIVEFVDYASEIRWLDASQVLISAQDFNFSSANTSWHQDSATATSPAGAAYAQILFGLDSPDFTAEQYLKLDNIEFKKTFPYYSSGNLTSYAYDTGDIVIFDAIAWDVDVTGAGTSIKFQLKTALDNNGAPGAWTDWLGPDGTSNTYYDTSGTSINTAHNNHQWVKYKVFLETSNTANTPVLNSLTISFSGGSWINTEWAEVQDAIAPTISSYSPTFTTSIQPTITISYQDNEKGTGVDLSSVQFLVDGSDVTNSVSSLTNSSLVYTPSSLLSVALHTVVLNISDNAGNTLSDTWYFSVKETIPTEISFRADKIMLIDGEPFFPITMYGTGIYGRGVPPAEDYGVIYSELQGAGFNSTQAYDTARTRVALMYEQAAANDLMIYFFPTATGDDYTDLYDNETDAASNIYDEINESALIGWYIGDDTSATATASQLTRLHKVATDVDPYHPTIIAVEANFYKSAGTSDIFMLENYPLISDSNQISEGVTLLTDTVDALEESGNSSQSFWSLVQAFGCQEEPCDDPDNSYYGFGWRMSTFQETKSLTYLSIIYGAKGIAFYIYSYASNPEDFWASLKSFTGELETLQPVLVSSDSNNYYSVEIEGDVEDSEGYDAVHTLLKEYNGKLYLFAVNTANETVSATFQLSEDPSLIDVEFESRSISTASKSFSDSFGAFEEHIYSWTTDTTSPQIEHTAQELAFVDDLITIQATVTDETELESVTLYYRLSDDSDWTSLAMTASLNVYTSTIQAPSVPGEIEYYIQVQDAAFHTTTQPSSSPGTPYTIEIQSGLPSVLSNLSVATSSSSAISLSWNDNSDNETGFKIYRNEVLITTTSADSTSYSDAGLKASTFYSYYVKATNDRGDSSASETVSATTESGGGAVPISFLRNGGGEVSLVVEEEITTQEQQASTVKQILALEMPVIPVLGKPVSKMTIEELQAKITEFLAVVQRLQVLLNQLTPNTFITDIPADYRFKITLKQGQSSDNIKYLQIFLNLDPQTQLESSGAGSPGNETSYFGSLTKAAVIKFQEKYSADILFPWDLTKGTGLVGKTTIAKINEIIERENGKI
ncbi:hypothetical protein KKB68_02875, partial [Patescibacteria group bacterium]|nr:hypothetical protein [Patescibacteria group bacterium]